MLILLRQQSADYRRDGSVFTICGWFAYPFVSRYGRACIASSGARE